MKESPQELINNGMKHLDEGEYAEAARKFEQLLELLDSIKYPRKKTSFSLIWNLIAVFQHGETE